MTMWQKKRRQAYLTLSLLALSLGYTGDSSAQTAVKVGNQNTGMNRMVSEKEYMDVINVGKYKNTYLEIKNVKVKSIDLGGQPNQVLFDVDQNGLVKLRALKENFPETNLLVITEDRMFQFLIRYAENQKTLYAYAPDNAANSPLEAQGQQPLLSWSGSDKDKPLPKSFEKAYMIRANIRGIDCEDKNLKLSLRNILQDRQYLYWVFEVNNKSRIDYTVDYLGFEVKNKGKEKKNKTLQFIFPAYLQDPRNSKVIPAGQQKAVCYATDKFALRKDEEMYISLYEKSSNSKGRQYRVKVTAGQFYKVGNL